MKKILLIIIISFTTINIASANVQCTESSVKERRVISKIFFSLAALAIPIYLFGSGYKEYRKSNRSGSQ